VAVVYCQFVSEYQKDGGDDGGISADKEKSKISKVNNANPATRDIYVGVLSELSRLYCTVTRTKMPRRSPRSAGTPLKPKHENDRHIIL